MTTEPDKIVATTHQELTLDLNADVAEWCPLPGPHSRLLAAGTYELDEITQQREGRIYLYKLQGDINNTNNKKLSLHLATTFDLPGIFDLRWLPMTNEPILAVALADGSLRLLQVTRQSSSGNNGNGIIEIEEVSRVESPVERGMALTVECRNKGDTIGGSQEAFITSFSDGTIATHQVNK